MNEIMKYYQIKDYSIFFSIQIKNIISRKNSKQEIIHIFPNLKWIKLLLKFQQSNYYFLFGNNN